MSISTFMDEFGFLSRRVFVINGSPADLADAGFGMAEVWRDGGTTGILARLAWYQQYGGLACPRCGSRMEPRPDEHPLTPGPVLPPPHGGAFLDSLEDKMWKGEFPPQEQGAGDRGGTMGLIRARTPA